MTPQIADVVERLARASGPDRELDEAIMFHLFRREQRYIGCQEEQDDGSWKPVEDLVWVDPTTGCLVGTGAREYTSSIDVARTLGGLCVFASDIGADGLPMVKIVADTSTTPIIEHTGIAPTLERAWCIAALKAWSQP